MQMKKKKKKQSVIRSEWNLVYIVLKFEVDMMHATKCSSHESLYNECRVLELFENNLP